MKLTGAEIDKLRNSELDAAVAEHVMGWVWVQLSQHERALVGPRVGDVLPAGVIVDDRETFARYIHGNLPAYSESWEHAGNILWRFPRYVITKRDDLVTVEIGKAVGKGVFPEQAICRAALKAVLTP